MLNLLSVPYKCENFIRKEGDFYRLIPGFGYDYTLVINDVTYKILELINARTKVEQILKSLILDYPQVDSKVIKKDLLNVLASLTKVKAIDFLGGELEMDKEIIYKDDKYSIEHLKEYDYRDVFQYLQKEGNCEIIQNSMTEQAYNEITVRMGFFNYIEEYYVLKKEKEIIALVSYRKTQTNLGNFYRNGIIKINSNINDDYLEKLLKCSSQHLIKNNIFNCKNIRVSYFLGTRDRLKELFKNAGFKDILLGDKNLIGNVKEAILDFNG